MTSGNGILLFTAQRSILLAQRANFLHDKISDLFMGPQSIGLVEKVRQIQRRPKMNPDYIFTIPIPGNLPGQVIIKAGDKDGDDLWPGLQNEFADAWLGPQEAIRVITLVPGPFRVKANDVARTCAAQFREHPK